MSPEEQDIICHQTVELLRLGGLLNLALSPGPDKLFVTCSSTRPQAPPSFSSLAVQAMESWAGPGDEACLTPFCACVPSGEIELGCTKMLHTQLHEYTHNLDTILHSGMSVDVLIAL